MPSPGAESIGSMFSGIGSFTEGTFPQFVYILWMTEPCATISLEELGDGHLAVLLAEHVLGGVPHHLRLRRAALGQLVKGDRAEELDLRNLSQLLRQPL